MAPRSAGRIAAAKRQDERTVWPHRCDGLHLSNALICNSAAACDLALHLREPHIALAPCPNKARERRARIFTAPYHPPDRIWRNANLTINPALTPCDWPGRDKRI